MRTPVLTLPWPGPGDAHPFWIKCENLQPMGAFKIRGAFNMLAQLPADARARGVITYSSGNHGQGVAMAAQAMGVPAVVVMPTTAPGGEGRGRADLRRRGDLRGHDLARPAAARRGRGRGPRPDRSSRPSITR